MKLSLMILILLLFINNKCIKKSVECHPQVHLTIKNTDTSNYTLVFHDKHTGNSKIEIKATTLQLMKNDKAENIIDYIWHNTDDCSFGLELDYKNTHWVTIEVIQNDTTINEFPYYPGNASTAPLLFSGDCVTKIYDTLTIP